MSSEHRRHCSSWINPLSDFINTKNNLSSSQAAFLSSPLSLTFLPPSLPPLRSAPPLISLIPSLYFLSSLAFYLPPLLALSWRPVVKCKHDWAPSQRGSTPISSSSALVLQSGPSRWYRRGIGGGSLRYKKSAAGKCDNCFHETNSRQRSKEDLVLLKKKGKQRNFAHF